MKTIAEIMEEQVVLGDGGYLIELERRGYVDSGSGREKVGTGRGSGQFTPEVAIENPEALRELHREFLNAGSKVLQALTFFWDAGKVKPRGLRSRHREDQRSCGETGEGSCRWKSAGGWERLAHAIDRTRRAGVIK